MTVELRLGAVADRFMRSAVKVVLMLGVAMAVLHVALASVAARSALEPMLAVAWALAWLLAWVLSDRVLDTVRRRPWLLVAVALAGGIPIALGGAWQSRLLADQMAVAWLAAVVTSWRVAVTTAVAIGVAYLGALLADGSSLAWLSAEPQRYDVVTNALNGLVAVAGGLAIVTGFRAVVTDGAGHLERVRLGGRGASPALAALIRGAVQPLLSAPIALDPGLTQAERAIVDLLADGLAPKEIAVRRSVSIHTVRAQIKAAKRKTGARTIEQLVALTWRSA